MKILLLIILLAISVPGIAQKKERAAFSPKHEIRLGKGFFPALPDNRWKDDRSDDDHYYSNDNYNDALHDKDRILIRSVSLGYSYDVARWLSIGATFTYDGDFEKIYNKFTQKKVGYNNAQYFILTPSVRINYLNRKTINLYSKIGVGISYRHLTYEYYTERDTKDDFHVSRHLTIFGMRVGSNFFAFGEFGYGSQGLFTVGIGYNFSK